jgi:WD40 repeat protein
MIYLWNVDQPERPVQVWSGHHADIKQIQWDPAGNLLASCSTDPYAVVWSVNKATPVQMFSDLDAHFNTIRWSNGGEGDPMLATGGEDGFIRIWNVATGNIVH